MPEMFSRICKVDEHHVGNIITQCASCTIYSILPFPVLTNIANAERSGPNQLPNKMIRIQTHLTSLGAYIHGRTYAMGTMHTKSHPSELP